jgi:hypothetical protein
MLRLVSIVFCVVAVAWFLGFALEQSKTASAHQQAEVNAAAPASQQTTASTATTPSGHGPQSGKSGLHKAVDDVFAKIFSPFSALTKGISSQWTLHIADTLLALLIYGVGLGFIARTLRLSSR